MRMDSLNSSDIDGTTSSTTTADSAGSNCSSQDAKLACSSKLEWYNSTSCSCRTFPLDELSLLDPSGIVFISIAIFSFVLDLSVVLVFIHARHTPIVKAANRELSFLLLFVLMVSLVFPLVRYRPITLTSCTVRICLEGPVATCVNAIFLVKTHRVLSIFEARLPKVVNRRWFLGRTLQLLGVFLVTLVQFIITGVCILVFDIDVSYQPDPNMMKTYVTCAVQIEIITWVYRVFITGLCLCFAFRARRLPENYGESRHILATMAITLSIIFICLGVSFQFVGTKQTIVFCVSLSLAPLTQLALLFLPKVYIILIYPERNTVQELRRMTLAHMQKQSEFLPDTEGGGAGRDGNRRQNATQDEPRRFSLRRKNKTIDLFRPTSSVSYGAAVAAAAAATPSGATKRKSLRNGGPGHVLNGRGPVAINAERATASITSDTSVIDGSGGYTKMSHKHLIKDTMRRQSSGLYVIQFLDGRDTPRLEDEVYDNSSLEADIPLQFSLRETVIEEERDGDMFVVSMLGRTLTSGTADEQTVGVPEILGGVYVGSTISAVSALADPRRVLDEASEEETKFDNLATVSEVSRDQLQRPAPRDSPAAIKDRHGHDGTVCDGLPKLIDNSSQETPQELRPTGPIDGDSVPVSEHAVEVTMDASTE